MWVVGVVVVVLAIVVVIVGMVAILGVNAGRHCDGGGGCAIDAACRHLHLLVVVVALST